MPGCEGLKDQKKTAKVRGCSGQGQPAPSTWNVRLQVCFEVSSRRVLVFGTTDVMSLCHDFPMSAMQDSSGKVLFLSDVFAAEIRI